MKSEKNNDDDMMMEMRERFAQASADPNSLRQKAADDIRFAFVPGEQWDVTVKAKRKNRPCYEFNRVRQSLRQITGEQRKNRPAVKIRATEQGDADTAEIFQGLIRNIESNSNADRAYDTAFQMSVSGGFGAFAILTEYADEEAFDQDIIVKEIRNPFSVYFDPAAQEFDKRDGLYAFITSLMGKEAFKAKYPKAAPVSFQDNLLDSRMQDWFLDEEVRIAEYWMKEPVTKTMILLSDGRTVEDDDKYEQVKDELAQQGITEIRRREVKTHKIMQYIVSGAEVLEGPTEWAGKYIPIVPVWGEMVNIAGQEIYSGMIRFARDAQKLYNANRTTAFESVAKSPKAPYLLTPVQLKGYQNLWDSANAEDYPYLPYNPDPQVPGGRPTRDPGPAVPAAMVQMLSLDADDIKATTGIYDASLGARSNETSGRAITARQNQGETANFEYIDNLSRAIKFAGEIFVDLIPKIYDTQRTVRILGQDGAEKWVELNKPIVDEQTGQTIVLNDLSRGRYDVAVTVGPGFATQRMEMLDAMMQMSQSNSPDAIVARYYAIKAMDIPGADEYAKVMRQMLLKQGILQPTPEDQKDAPPPQPPSPQEQLQMRSAEADVQAKELANAKAQKELQAPPQQDNSGQIQMQTAELNARLEMEKLQAEMRLEMEKLNNANNLQMQKDQANAQLQIELESIRQSAAIQIEQMKLSANAPQQLIADLQAIVDKATTDVVPHQAVIEGLNNIIAGMNAERQAKSAGGIA